jgi:hypothetical protein
MPYFHILRKNREGRGFELNSRARGHVGANLLSSRALRIGDNLNNTLELIDAQFRKHRK